MPDADAREVVPDVAEVAQDELCAVVAAVAADALHVLELTFLRTSACARAQFLAPGREAAHRPL